MVSDWFLVNFSVCRNTPMHDAYHKYLRFLHWKLLRNLLIAWKAMKYHTIPVFVHFVSHRANWLCWRWRWFHAGTWLKLASRTLTALFFFQYRHKYEHISCDYYTQTVKSAVRFLCHILCPSLSHFSKILSSVLTLHVCWPTGRQGRQRNCDKQSQCVLSVISEPWDSV